MGLCPVCNNFGSIQLDCPVCTEQLDDIGRWSDYFGQYSPYMEIDDLKLFNGVKNDNKDQLCLHLYTCPRCGYDDVVPVQEV